MVKLRVAARVIPEGDYNAAQSTQGTERKFLVVVRNPEDWYIGTLAVEIQNTYKRIYKQYALFCTRKSSRNANSLQ